MLYVCISHRHARGSVASVVKGCVVELRSAVFGAMLGGQSFQAGLSSDEPGNSELQRAQWVWGALSSLLSMHSGRCMCCTLLYTP